MTEKLDRLTGLKADVEAAFRRHIEAAPYAKDLLKRLAFEVVPLIVDASSTDADSQHSRRVKPLEWNDDVCPAAECVFGHYVINPHYCRVELLLGYGNMSMTGLGRVQLDRGASLNELKAAAQADYEGRIAQAMTASDASPPNSHRVDAVGAARVLYEAFQNADALPPAVRKHAGDGHFFSALRLIFEPDADLRRPAKRSEIGQHVAELEAQVAFTLSDASRMLRKQDVEGACPHPDDCFYETDRARCGPCAVKASAAKGVEADDTHSNLPEVCRLRREVRAAEARIAELEAAIPPAPSEPNAASGSLRYEPANGRTIDEMREAFRQSKLYLAGDAVLVWANQGDLLMPISRSPAEHVVANDMTRMRTALEMIAFPRDGEIDKDLKLHIDFVTDLARTALGATRMEARP